MCGAGVEGQGRGPGRSHVAAVVWSFNAPRGRVARGSNIAGEKGRMVSLSAHRADPTCAGRVVDGWWQGHGGATLEAVCSASWRKGLRGEGGGSVEVGTRRRMGSPSVDAGGKRGDSAQPSRPMYAQFTTLCTCTRRRLGSGGCRSVQRKGGAVRSRPAARGREEHVTSRVRGAMCGHPHTGSAKAVE